MSALHLTAWGVLTGTPSSAAPSCTLPLLLTCAEEEDVVLPVLSLHPVHHELAQPLGQVCLHQEGPAVPGQHGLEHEGVGTGKVQHLVREVLGAAILPPGLVGGLAGTLQGQQGTSSAQPPQHPSLLPSLHCPSEMSWVPLCLPVWHPSLPPPCQTLAKHQLTSPAGEKMAMAPSPPQKNS